MATTVTPATTITEPSWSFLTISRNLAILGTPGVITPTWNVNLAKGSQVFLGDANGNPISPLMSTPGAPGQPAMTQAPLDLSEVVTRADGTKLTVLQLLDNIAMAAATPTPAA